MIFRYRRQDDQLELTPITWKGPQPESATTWMLSSAGKGTDTSP
jgi:hypothetical protein